MPVNISMSCAEATSGTSETPCRTCCAFWPCLPPAGSAAAPEIAMAFPLLPRRLGARLPCFDFGGSAETEPRREPGLEEALGLPTIPVNTGRREPRGDGDAAREPRRGSNPDVPCESSNSVFRRDAMREPTLLRCPPFCSGSSKPLTLQTVVLREPTREPPGSSFLGRARPGPPVCRCVPRIMKSPLAAAGASDPPGTSSMLAASFASNSR
mmetsp:Transcript_51413/g.94295  ORF Transcript_51413/g.94295 Transcript_51413/m.94295 type:complete len:211 (-) Transcript_51413:165-797(-)